MDSATTAALMSSACMDWETPDWLIAAAHAFKRITLDPATAPDNPTLARTYYAPPHTDGLAKERDWVADCGSDGHMWKNPPYGHGIADWIDRAVRECPRMPHATILTPARTDTRWYRRLITPANALVYVEGRLLFKIRCSVCTFAGRPAVYASRCYKGLGGKTVFVCPDHLPPEADHRPIQSATFPSLLTYFGDEPERWGDHFGRYGDLRKLRERPRGENPAQTRLVL